MNSNLKKLRKILYIVQEYDAYHSPVSALKYVSYEKEKRCSAESPEEKDEEGGPLVSYGCPKHLCCSA